MFSGETLDNVSRIEVSASYDTSLLTNPRVTAQSSFDGAKVIVNGQSTGSVRMTVMSNKPMNGNGTFATLTFDNIGNKAGVITSLTGNIFGANGARLPAAFVVTNPPPALDPNDPDDASMLPGGKFYMPDGGEYRGEERPEAEKSPTDSGETQAPPGRETSMKPPAEVPTTVQPEKSVQRTVRQAQSVLERFRLFERERTPKNLIALFDTKDAKGFKQDPPVFLADGVSTLKITLTELPGNKAPSIAFTSARFAAQHKVSEKEWVIEAVPKKGVTSAEMTVLTDAAVLEIPFTVAPKVRVDLIIPGKVGEKDFALYLKKRGTKGAVKYDLNGDGKRDYIDDYIFTANYIVALKEQEKKQSAEKKKQAPLQKPVDASRE